MLRLVIFISCDFMTEGGLLNKVEREPVKENAVVLDSLDWQKIAFQKRGEIIRQLNEVAQYCKEQRKTKRPSNNLKNSWARTEISALSTMLAGLKDVELEILKAKLEVLENVIRTDGKKS